MCRKPDASAPAPLRIPPLAGARLFRERAHLMFGIGELALILIVLVLVLGAKKLPELARAAGKSARILKSEAKAMKEEGKKDSAQDTAAGQAVGGTQGESHVITGRVVEREDPPARS